MDTECLACIRAVLQIAVRIEVLSRKTHYIEPTSYLCQSHSTHTLKPLRPDIKSAPKERLPSAYSLQLYDTSAYIEELPNIRAFPKMSDNSPGKPYTTMTRSNTSGPIRLL